MMEDEKKQNEIEQQPELQEEQTAQAPIAVAEEPVCPVEAEDSADREQTGPEEEAEARMEPQTEEAEPVPSRKKRIAGILVTGVLVLAILLCIGVISQVLSKGYVSIGRYSLFRVVTGSMEPEIPVGSLLVSSEVDISDIQVGDIVNYRSKESGMFGVIITHRVIQIFEGPDGEILLETKGDANQYADGHLIDQDYLIGKTVSYTKKGNFFAGILNFLTGKVGFLACIVFPCLLIGALTMRDCVKNLREEMDAITRQLNKVESAVNSNSLEVQLGEEAYQELCDRLRGELLEELKQGAEENKSEERPGADHQ